MNPKDMTNEALLDAWLKEMKGDYEHGCPCESEVQRRLNERDVLRKENEELAKWLERAWLYLCKLCKNHPSWVTVRSLRDAIRFAIAAHRARIEASKESEASHESIIEANDSGDKRIQLKE